MKKVLTLKLNGSEMELEFPDRDNVIYIVGADTYLGAHFVKHWLAHGYEVFGCGSAKSVPNVAMSGYSVTDYRTWNIPHKKYSWLMFCHDPRNGYDEHTGAVRSLCEYLMAAKRSVRIYYPSSATVCTASKRAIRETNEIVPHNRLEMAIVTAEQWLQTYCCESDSGILPFIFRLGEVYGKELETENAPGMVNQYLCDATKKKTLQVPGLGNRYRSLTHVGDVCEASIKVMEMDIPPRCVNIPGERYSIIDIVIAIAEKYHNETGMGAGGELGDYYSKYVGDRTLSASFFNRMVSFVPNYSFKNWLAGNRSVAQ